MNWGDFFITLFREIEILNYICNRKNGCDIPP